MQMGLGSNPDLQALWPGPLPYVNMGLVRPTFHACYKAVKCQGFSIPPASSMKSPPIPAAHLLPPSSESLTVIRAFH